MSRTKLTKIVSAATAVFAAVSVATTVSAYEYYNSNYSGEVYHDGDFYYVVEDGKAILTGYAKEGGEVNIPSELGGYPVKELGTQTYMMADKIVIPEGVESIGTWAIGNGDTSLRYDSYSVYIPKSVKLFDSFAVGCCTYQREPLIKIYGEKGSEAEAYAREQGYTFNDEFYCTYRESEYCPDLYEFKPVGSRMKFDVTDWVEIRDYDDSNRTERPCPKEFDVYYKRSTARTWTKAGSGESTVISFKKEGTFDIKVEFADKSFDTYLCKYYIVDPDTRNTSYLSADTIEKGSKVTIYGSTTGMISEYCADGDYYTSLEPARNYTYRYKKSTAKNWTTVNAASDAKSVTLTFRNAGVYDIAVDAEGAGTKEMKLYVKDGDLDCTAKISSQNITAGTRLTITGSATGGTGDYRYTYSYKRENAGKWTVLAQDTTLTSVGFRVNSPGKLLVKVDVTDPSCDEAGIEWTVNVT